MSDRLTHIDEDGAARMVDVGGKGVTARVAVARGRVRTENSSPLWTVVRLSVFFLFLAMLGGFIITLLLAVLGDSLRL